MPEKSPIADLSYRNYQEGLAAPSHRWMVIMRRTFQAAIQRKAFWWLLIASSAHYLILIAAAYVIENFASGGAGAGGDEFTKQFFSRIVWRDQFLSGFQVGHLFLLAIVLIAGAGAIAEDNKSNALLVYLSKPCTKLDYLLGKFLGILLAVMLFLGAPAVVFYAYGAANYRPYGFISDNPFLFLQMVLSVSLASAYVASLIIGMSSLFRSGRWAGATYAAIYLVAGLFAGLTATMAQSSMKGDTRIVHLLDNVHYMSIFGGIEAIYKTVLGTDGSSPFDTAAELAVPRPGAGMVVFVVLVPVVVSWLIAWRKVRAVEVVG